jgi:hypothetical protein
MPVSLWGRRWRTEAVAALTGVVCGLIVGAGGATAFDSDAGPSAAPEQTVVSRPGSSTTTPPSTDQSSTVPSVHPSGPDNGGDGPSVTSAPPTTQVTPATPPPTAVTDPPPGDDGYAWDLPLGDISPNESSELDTYNALVTGCDQGQSTLDSRWENYRSPRSELLYSAAVDVCRGNLVRARQYMDAGTDYPGYEGWPGWTGVGNVEWDCRTYKAVRSVLDQQSQKDVKCPLASPGEHYPEWRPSPRPDERCDRPSILVTDATCPEPSEDP